MKNLVVTVSLDSSTELLEPFADIVILDAGIDFDVLDAYDSVYIRSHFSHPSLSPQNFRTEIDKIVSRAGSLNPQVRFVDGMSTVDCIVGFEDKWSQYKVFHQYMPESELYVPGADTSKYQKPVFKSRLSSRGSGVTWSEEEVDLSANKWIIQESLDIVEELRVYVICGVVYDTGSVRQSMTAQQGAQAISTRQLRQDEVDFSLSVIAEAPELDLVGLDIARTSDGLLKLIEANRSPGFAKFYQLSGINLATVLYQTMSG